MQTDVDKLRNSASAYFDPKTGAPMQAGYVQLGGYGGRGVGSRAGVQTVQTVSFPTQSTHNKNDAVKVIPPGLQNINPDPGWNSYRGVTTSSQLPDVAPYSHPKPKPPMGPPVDISPGRPDHPNAQPVNIYLQPRSLDIRQTQAFGQRPGFNSPQVQLPMVQGVPQRAPPQSRPCLLM